jgi:phage terminase large subunit-like protein
VGNPQPRVQTPPAPAQGNRVGDLVALAEALGTPLLEWQKNAATEILKTNDAGLFVNKTSVIVCARQNGKTTLLRLLILCHLFLWDSKLIVATAQDRAIARETFKAVADIIMETSWLRSELKGTPRFANGQEAIETKSGARFLIVAPNSGARGLSADFVIIDELREHRNEDSFSALAYTTMARPNATMLCLSNAGDASSVVLNRFKDTAKRMISNRESGSFCWLEWSAKDNAKLDDPKAWAAANPALGQTITAEAIRSRLRDNPNVFRTEVLSQWVTNLSSPFPDGLWDSCLDEKLEITAGKPIWFALDINQLRTHCVLVAAQQQDNDIAVGLIQEWKSERTMDAMIVANEIASYAKKYNVRSVSMMRDGGMYFQPLLAQQRINTALINFVEYGQSCDELLGAMAGGRLKHAGQTTLNEHINNAAKYSMGEGGWRIGRKDQDSEVLAAVALAMAVHHATPRSQIARIVSA